MRISDRTALVLTSLADGDKHAYAVAKDIEEFAGETLGAGTLFAALSRLEHNGLIERLEPDDRRNPYRITQEGREVLAEYLAKSAQIASLGLQRMALGGR